MTKFKKTLILSVAVLLVLGGAVAALLLIPSEPEQPEASPSPSPSPQGALIGESKETVKSVDFSPADGKSFTITIADGKCDMRDKTDILPYSESALGTVADYAVSQPNALIVAQEATSAQLSDFGFDRPGLKWRVNRTDGTFSELELGGMNATKDRYYARQTGSKTVYAISATAGDAMLRQEYEYYDLALIKMKTDENNQLLPLADTLRSILLEKADGSVISLLRRSNEEQEGADIGASAYRMLEPYAAEASDYQVGELLGGKIQAISPSEVADPEPADLAQYGLDNPDRLRLEDWEGWSLTLLIGGPGPDNAGRYLMVEGSRSVLLDKAGDYSFLTADPLRLRSSLVWLVDVKTITGVDYNLDGTMRTLKLDITDDAESALLDGKEIDPLNGKRLYTRTLELTIDGVDKDTRPGPLKYQVTIRLKEGGERVMKLYPLNDRQYLIELDGETDGFYIGVAKIQRLLEGFEIVDSGGEIPFN